MPCPQRIHILLRLHILPLAGSQGFVRRISAPVQYLSRGYTHTSVISETCLSRTPSVEYHCSSARSAILSRFAQGRFGNLNTCARRSHVRVAPQQASARLDRKRGRLGCFPCHEQHQRTLNG